MQRPVLPFVLLLGLLPAAVPLVAQAPSPVSNAELMANDHYTRSHDFDLIHQRIVVSAFDWSATTFEGNVTTTLVARRPGLDAVVLDEGALLENTRVSDRDGHTLETTRHGDTLVVRPARPLALGDTLVFTIVYHGKITSGQGLTFITSDGRTHRPDQIWSQGEDHNNHFWFPTYDFPNDKMTWEMVASVPKGDLAISNGRLVSNVVSGANRVMTWRQESPSATYLVSLIVAPLARIHDTWQGVPVDYYTYHDDSTRAWQLFHVTPDMIGTYSRLTGIRYPWAKYAQTTVADFFGGMENVSATTLVDWLPDSAAYRDRPWYQYILIPHELAHQWFGDYVTTENWANMWLNEGFAEFMPGQYWGEKLGAHAAQDYYLDEYRQFQQIERGRSMPLASLGSNNIYPKGALVLEMLKDYLGAPRFWASVHRYLVDHALDNATSDDLRQAVLDATGENLDWFWDEWVYGAGMPRFAVRSTYDTTAHRLTLSVRQTQVDSFTPDTAGRLFRVPQVFRMPVAIRIGTASGSRVVRAELHERAQEITIDSLAGPPTMVIFDDGNHILKTLDFEQPVGWLAEQLQHDDNLWNRQWAIEQLAGHRGDPVALAALQQAATGADYYLTRSAAVDALGELPAADAIAALTKAASDTSAAVRTSVMNALGQVGGSAATSLVREAFSGDPSYEVRAAALTAMAQLKASGLHDALETALRTPSYQDVIQTAALRGAVQANDTSLVAGVDRLVGQQQLAAHALAAFAAQGSAPALALLSGHLNDRGKAVRGWAVAAFQATLARGNKAMALQALRAALPGLQYQETKAAVSELIAALAK